MSNKITGEKRVVSHSLPTTAPWTGSVHLPVQVLFMHEDSIELTGSGKHLFPVNS